MGSMKSNALSLWLKAEKLQISALPSSSLIAKEKYSISLASPGRLDLWAFEPQPGVEG